MEDKEKRKKRNARYYLKRKLRRSNQPVSTCKVHEEKKASYAKIIPIRSKDSAIPKQLPHRTLDRVLSGTFLMLLVGAMTIFLIHETYLYFFEAEKISWLAFLKALLCEGIILSFSLGESDQLLTRIMQKLLVASMCGYSLWAISSGVVSRAVQDWNESKASQSLVLDLETQVREKQNLLQIYLTRDWITAARATQKELDVLNKQLAELRLISVKLKSPQMILNFVLNLVIFRFLVLLANILSVRRLRNYLLEFEGIHLRTLKEAAG